jgi:hypothetical protein
LNAEPIAALVETLAWISKGLMKTCGDSARQLLLNCDLPSFFSPTATTTNEIGHVSLRNRPDHSNREMSKRHRQNSPPNSSAKTTRVSQPTKPFICELPPTCSKHPTTLGSSGELESHYSTCHAHTCSAEGCNRIFPEPRFLALVRRSPSPPVPPKGYLRLLASNRMSRSNRRHKERPRRTHCE